MEPVAPGSVSVVIPVHDNAGTVAACLRSVAAQTLRPAELILVDDRGRDGAVAVARRTLAGLDLPHRVIAHERNRGAGAARNTGLARATGTWVWFLDSDDEADPRFLARMVEAGTAYGAGIVACRTRRVGPDGTPREVDEPPWERAVVAGPEAARLLLRNRVRAYPCNKLFRRTALPAGVWDEGRAYEDFLPTLRLLLDAPRVALVDEPLYRYTANPVSVSARFGRHTFDLLAVAEDVRAELARRGLARAWRAEHLGYRYLNVVLPLANMALRAEHRGHADRDTRAAVAAARGRTRMVDLAALAVAGWLRAAVAGGVLKLSPGLYSRVLASR
ncbi:glycosyltransferase family 2 protein [Phytohabitans sp. ZYX-F-186]|uniref:Glycosyltransferase family 2 protein n=1 Tax=Phytohabitans maris TaxID=3071409 RepID=A0ABU0ZB32_9ACTN|nr:glycosyltransferase family 2 protein [Phytohabitans sp. ZYX-F-186]MDQ7903576.1 glycosyltransferase family 2 protein [Phytohabitans sp. ZYX-F-186]